MDLMERLVCDWKWLGRLAWAVPILLCAAVKLLGAPPPTIAYGLFAEVAFVCWLQGRAMRRHPDR